MRIITEKQRARDVQRTLNHRRIGKEPKTKCIILPENLEKLWKHTNKWIKDELEKGLNLSTHKSSRNYKNRNKGKYKRKIAILTLPEEMNFDKNYNATVQHISAIRKLVEQHDKFKGHKLPKKAYRLGSVNFENLKNISTSAALVLTAEISKWNISIRKKLQPGTSNWHDNIYNQFTQLGFFDLFTKKPDKTNITKKQEQNIDFVRYIRGDCENRDEAKSKKKFLKNRIIEIVGENIKNWTLLHSGLSEAITNVYHHAYTCDQFFHDKSWYLTGSFNKDNNQLKIAFYDQGLGIPKTLPKSSFKERFPSFKSVFMQDDKATDSTLLKAALETGRTSTGENDRGKGLQDLLEFTRRWGEGYLAILSCQGLYKLEIDKKEEKTISGSLERPIPGTLIIWCVNLNS